METADALRASYRQASDDDLRVILDAGTTQLSQEARSALMEEVARRRMLGEVNPLDKLAWPAEVAEVRRYPKVGLGRRLAARILDMLVPVPLMLGSGILIAIGVTSNASAFTALGVMAMICSFGWGIYYSFTKDGRGFGQSIGKKKLNLMVVNITTNKPCTKGESFLRELDLFFLQMFPIVGWLVEPIFIVASDDGRRLGDRAADTQVIDVNDYRTASL